ncbi:MAG: asparagine synthase (glutamine-hydrolyzing) [Verrucomicrobia bacterium]|nr:MAG: asparagine synthase (glutamine-hydrolyzing) [Verrucomicrobiota bacterium]
MVERMQSSLVHRGPDDRGLFVASNYRCALAHTRLSILDLSPAGHQPMGLGGLGTGSAEHGAGWEREGRGVRREAPAVGGRPSTVGHQHGARYWIVFNGEIYNYRELRKELGAGSGELGAGEEQGARSREQGAGHEQGAGSREQRAGEREQGSEVRGQKPPVSGQPSTVSNNAWRSNTDTEVILRAYEKWGLGCLEKLRGMFAFAIWDNREQKLILARDPFGIKPLYYYQSDRFFLFASEVRPLLASGLVSRKLLIVKLEDRRPKTEVFRYANDVSHQADDCIPASRTEAVEILRAKLEESIRVHLISDVPLGAFLSGGIDSSAIVALMTRVAGQRPKTFSVVFEESEFSEGEHAKLVARKFGTEHREILLSEESLLDLLPNALEAMDQPTMDGINAYVISKAVRESGVTVALSGLGGDELFGGYPSFRRAKQLQLIGMAPFGLRKLASAVAGGFSNGSVRQRKFWDLVESDCSPAAAYAISRQLFAPADIVNLTARDQMSEACPEQSRRVRGQCPDVGKSDEVPPQAPRSMLHADLVNEVSVLELTGYMANTLLRDTDQMSMAHALEVRVPFIDPVVVQYVLRLPGSWKVDGERSKPLLVDALGKLLPEDVWKRPKMGFTLPFERWMRSSLQGEVDDVLSSGNGLANVGVNNDFGRGVWRAFRDNPRHEAWSRPWALFVLKRWCDLNDVHL